MTLKAKLFGVLASGMLAALSSSPAQALSESDFVGSWLCNADLQDVWRGISATWTTTYMENGAIFTVVRMQFLDERTLVHYGRAGTWELNGDQVTISNRTHHLISAMTSNLLGSGQAVPTPQDMRNDLNEAILSISPLSDPTSGRYAIDGDTLTMNGAFTCQRL